MCLLSAILWDLKFFVHAHVSRSFKKIKQAFKQVQMQANGMKSSASHKFKRLTPQKSK